jgi:adenosine deaminase
MTPKAELHVHLEGAAPPDLVRRLAKRNNMMLPEEIFGADGSFVWDDFLHFLKVYDAAASVIHTAEDYRDVTYEYLAACAAEGAIYVEVMSSPDHAAANGMSYLDHVLGIAAGIDDARDAHGIEGRLIVTCVRHFGPECAVEVARQVVDNPHPLVTGFGMGGDEAGHPPAQFAEAFGIVAASGLPCTVHAGEWAGPEKIREAIDTLPVTRLGHGVRSIEDPRLVDYLAARGITLEVCPGSNLATGIYESYAHHPLPRLIKAGVKVTLGSDDPPFFATSIGGEYEAARDYFGLSEAELIAITRTALEAAFVDDDTRRGLLARISGETPPG